MKNRGERNKETLKRIVDSGKIPGVIAFVQGEPVGWCAVAPRDEYPTLERSRILRRVDDEPVWSVVCFFVAKKFRHRGITVKLLHSAIDYVRRRGGKIVEGYPIEPTKARTPDPFAYTGLVTAFRKAGFAEAARRSKTRPVMRYRIGKNQDG
jgi:GNAT superfamily N-acetyltransferase